MKLNQIIKENYLDHILKSRFVPVVFLILAFVAVTVILSGAVAEADDSALNGDLNGMDTIIEAETTKAAAAKIPDVSENLTESVKTPLLVDSEPVFDFEGIEVHIKKLTFDDFYEDKETEIIETELGFRIIIKRILLDEYDFEGDVERELSLDDFDIAYVPYRETISIVKSQRFYQDFELNNNSYLLTFNNENIGVISNSYPAAGLFYNKRIIEEAGLEDPLELFKRGEWNLANFYRYLEETTIDRNGDGITDIFGIVINEDLTDNLAAANGIQVLSLSEDGELILEINNPGFKEILDLINRVYSNGFKGGMSKQGFIDARASFYNDDASVYTELSNVMADELGFVSYPSDIGLVKSASAKIDVAVLNRNKTVDDRFLKMLCYITNPRDSSLEYFSSIFDDEAVISMCVEMTKNNYISPIYMFRELHEFYLDVLRDVKAGFSVSEMLESFGSGNEVPTITYP